MTSSTSSYNSVTPNALSGRVQSPDQRLPDGSKRTAMQTLALFAVMVRLTA